MSEKTKPKAEKPGLYIVFSPEGETPPKVTHGTFKEAATAAWHMSRFHMDRTFHVMKAVGRPFVFKKEDMDEALLKQVDHNLSVMFDLHQKSRI